MINIEKEIVSFLTEHLDVDVYKDVPSDRPVKFVSVETTGGTTRNFLANPQVAIQCWDATEYEASELAFSVAKTLGNIIYYHSKIYKCVCNVPYSFSDGTAHRYQFIADLYTS